MNLLKKHEEQNFIFIDKAVFFPDQKILAIGDLHLGYEHMLIESGVNIPETQIKDITADLKKIFSKVKSLGFQMNKIVFLGDIKHYFGFEFKERNSFIEILDFLRENFDDKDIILIKGNHDKMDYLGKKMKNYYIKNGLCFLHGHMSFLEIYDEKVKTIVMGHLHPSVIISDEANVKREKFKCFLTGDFHGKNIIVLPSFFEIIEGTSINDYEEEYHKYFSIIPKDTIMNFKIHIIGEDKVYDFGKVKDID